METLIKVLGGLALVAIILAGVALLLAFPTKWLWNWLMPAIFQLPRITAWQALGMNLLTGLLFHNSPKVESK